MDKKEHTNTPLIQTLLCDLILAGARVDASQLLLMLQPLTFPPFEIWVSVRVCQHNYSNMAAHGYRTPTIPHNRLARFVGADWQTKGNCTSGPLIRAPLSAMLACCTQPFEPFVSEKLLRKGKFMRNGCNLWCRGHCSPAEPWEVSKSGFNENIWQRGCVTWLGFGRHVTSIGSVIYFYYISGALTPTIWTSGDTVSSY